jgi:hypothetical protein
MITLEDLPAVPILASVPPEGVERSLFVVLAGRIEVTKVIDGIFRPASSKLLRGAED